VIALASIPSPPEWLRVLQIPVGKWLHFIGVPETFTINIYAYAVFIIIGIVLACVLTNARIRRRGAEPGVIFDMALFVVIFGIVGARIFHVITHPNDYFAGQAIYHVFFIWEGGLAIFGGLLGGTIGMLIGCRVTGLRFWSFADAVVPGLLLAQTIGRLGNYFNQELFGLPTDGWWGLQIDSPNSAIPVGLPDGTLFQPTFLYEMLWNGLGVVVLLLASRHGRGQWGKLTGLYLIWYGAGRIVWENIRIDPSEVYFGLRVNVWAAIGAVILGLIIIAVQSRRHVGAEPSLYRPGREWVPTPAVDSADTYSDTDEPGDEAPSEGAEPATSGKTATS
jgi:prolipoprotein diacylglyceryl transferase